MTGVNTKAPEVVVLGLGYIGLPTALLLADAGVTVTGVDIDQDKLAQLNAGKLPFAEPGLAELWARVRSAGTFTVAAQPPACRQYLVAVPTPSHHHQADLSYLMAALSMIGTAIDKTSSKTKASRPLIIIESTVGLLDPVTTIAPAVAKISSQAQLAYCPERALPGNTLYEMVGNDRVIGAADQPAGRRAAKLYRRFVKGSITQTDLTTAAAAKLLENTYRSVNIALANQLAQIAERTQFDAWQAIELANHHPRVNVHQPGPGVGGHCLPIDPWFLASADSAHSSLISEALRINAEMPRYIAQKIKAIIDRLKLSQPTVGVLGVSYKADVDDIRESPSLELIRQLAEVLPSATVRAHDPNVSRATLQQSLNSPNDTMVSMAQLHRQAEVVVIAVNHRQYYQPRWDRFRRLRAVVDTKHLLSPKIVQQLRDNSVEVSVLGHPPPPNQPQP